MDDVQLTALVHDILSTKSVLFALNAQQNNCPYSGHPLT